MITNRDLSLTVDMIENFDPSKSPKLSKVLAMNKGIIRPILEVIHDMCKPSRELLQAKRMGQKLSDELSSEEKRLVSQIEFLYDDAATALDGKEIHFNTAKVSDVIPGWESGDCQIHPAFVDHLVKLGILTV
jgi:hypothetical protein